MHLVNKVGKGPESRSWVPYVPNALNDHDSALNFRFSAAAGETSQGETRALCWYLQLWPSASLQLEMTWSPPSDKALRTYVTVPHSELQALYKLCVSQS